ncbi:MAG: ornithine cyclodeaminase family protein [Chloroflexi bacterium]|nr:ornithine cyclodeaminase family protein [Chloroflexota bacterium]
MALFLTEADVRELLTMADGLRAVEAAFQRWGKGQATNHPRQRIRTGRTYLHYMAAADAALGVMGFKVYSTGPNSRFLVNLYSTESAELLAIMESQHLATVRTGAATGVATQYLARADAWVVGVIGTGYQAKAQLEAVCAVRPVREVKAYSRTAERRSAFAQNMTDALGIPVRAVDTAEECVRASHIIITITTSREPVFQGDWLSPGTHINAAGSNHWMRRELDETTLKRCALIVADDLEAAKMECGELVWAVERGALRWEQVRELREVASGRCPGRQSDTDITLFESQGLAIEDIAMAEHVYRLALERSRGRELLLSEIRR